MPHKTYQLHPVEFAEYIVGCFIQVNDCSGRIVEAEAYTDTPEDYSSHAHTRKKSAGEIMNTAGIIYVYSIHAGLATNITTDPENTGAVLIRAIEPLQGIEQMIHRRSRSGSKISKTWQRDDMTTLRSLTDGPSKLSEALGIQKEWNNTPVDEHLLLLDKTEQPVIASSSRIGISSSRDLPWRFYDRNSPFVSR
mgnify:CR=1 FL=1